MNAINCPLNNGNPAIVQIVTDADLENSELVRDARTFAANIRVPRGRMLDFLADGYRDCDTIRVEAEGNRAEIDLELLERDGIEWWFKDWCKRPLPNVTPRVRVEARERARVVITLLRLIFPKESVVWGVDPERLRLIALTGVSAPPE